MTIIWFDFWKQIEDPNTIINEKEEFQGVKHDGLKIVKVTHMTLHFEKQHGKNLMLIVDKLAHKLIIGNEFLTQYKCDLLNSAKAIVFGNE